MAGRYAWLDLLRLLDRRGVREGLVTDPPDDRHPLDTLCANTRVIDFRQTPRPKDKARGRAKGVRKLPKITGIMLHQTAADLGDADRFLSIPSHSGVPGDATIVLLQHLTAYMWHGHSGNSFTIGIEIAARADGIDGNSMTFWRSKKERNGYKDRRGVWHSPKRRSSLRREVTDAQVVSARHLCRYYVDEVARLVEDAQVEAPGLKVVMAHRQTARKSGDPGSRIWKEVGEWCIDELGLQPGPVLRPGSQLPTAWTARGETPYNHRVRGF